MATKLKKTHKESLKPRQSPFNDYWGKNNYYLLYAGLGLLIIGYVLMAQGPWDNVLSITISPIVLVFAYAIVIPISIIVKFSKKDSDVSSKG